MTLSERRACTLHGMNPRRARRAFTLVELLVALIMMGVAVAGLAGALAGDRRLRNQAAAHLFAADRVRERLEQLAVLPCSADASGSSTSPWGSERWRASPSQLSWSRADTLMLGRSPAPLVIQARILCPD
jgi:prepilin-type N-terminal cleavage/methylation domain-containing protein